MQATFKLSIGLNEQNPTAPEDYTQVKFDCQLQKERIEQKLTQLKEKTGKFRVPTIILDFPESAKNLKLDYLSSSHVFEFSQVEKNGRLIKSLDMKEKEMIMMKKKYQKLYGKLTQLKNNVFLHIDLYNIDSYHQKLQKKQQYPLAVFLEKAKIEGKLDTDPQLFQMFSSLSAKVSPKFAQSPLMALFPLFDDLQIEMEMDSLNQLEEVHQKKLFRDQSYEEPDDDEEGKGILQSFGNKEKVYVHFAFESLAVLTVELELRMFAYYHCLH